MKNAQQARLANLELLFRECEAELGKSRGAAALLSRKSGVPAPLLSQLRHRVENPGGEERKMGDITARKLEVGMNKPSGWMDHDHGPARTVEEADLLDVYRHLTPGQRKKIADMAEELSDLNAAARAVTAPSPAPAVVRHKHKRPPNAH